MSDVYSSDYCNTSPRNHKYQLIKEIFLGEIYICFCVTLSLILPYLSPSLLPLACQFSQNIS